VNTLHGRIETAIEQRLAVAQAATPGPWRVCAEGSEGSRVAPATGTKREQSRFIGIANGRVQPEDGRNARHIAANDPARIIRDCTEDLAVLDEHAADDEGFCYARTHMGLGCLYLVCPEVLSLARRYDIPQEDS